jgi:anti-sigma factor RsiW
VSHLGDNLSALVDGELAGADLDRANAHLAACERCRGDAAALRTLKSQLRDLAAHTDHDDLTLRLLAMAGPCAGSSDDDEDDRSPRRRYLVWSALSLAVVGGVGAAAFSMGGGPSGPGPDVVPQVEMFSVQHASTTGDVPFPEPSRLQVRAAKHTP